MKTNIVLWGLMIAGLGFIFTAMLQGQTAPAVQKPETRSMQTQIENDAIELAYKDLLLKEADVQKELAPFQQKLSDAIEAARKSQGLGTEFEYSMVEHKFVVPKKVAPDGTPVQKKDVPKK